jgi:hypothetical protein
VEGVWSGVEVQLNGYLPVGSTRETVDRQTFTSSSTTSSVNEILSGSRFSGNSLLFDTNRITTFTTLTRQLNLRQDQIALGGLDAEAGIKLAQWQPDGDLRSYLGLYYYSGSTVSGFVGVRGRLVARINQNASVGFSVQGDREFGTTAAVTVGLTFPGVSRSRTSVATSTWARMGDSPHRTQTVAVTERTNVSRSTTTTSTSTTETRSETATNPTTGQPYVFQHAVLGAIGGNGTFENPFGTIAAALTAAPGDGNGIVYVQPGTVSSPGFVIKDGVQVFSTGPVQTLATGQRGTVQLPLSGTGLRPQVTGPVTMGNDTTLAGFNVTGFAGNGIVGTGIRNVTIRDNTVTNLTGTGNGISLTGNLTGTVNILRNTFASLAERGINIIPTQAIAQPLQITIRDNTIDLTGLRGIESFAGGNTTATYLIANNIINRSATIGILLATFGTPQIRAIIDANQVQQTVLAAGFQIGIGLQSTGGQLFASVTNNQLNNPGVFTPNQVEFRAIINNGTLCLRLLNNTAVNTGFRSSQMAGLLQQEPLVGNTGIVQPNAGTITNVPAGTCGF